MADYGIEAVIHEHFHTASEDFFAVLSSSIARGNAVIVGIAGGRSVPLYMRKLVPYFSKLVARDLAKLHFFLVDERVTSRFEETNRKVIEESLCQGLIEAGLSGACVNFFEYDSKDILQEVKDYSQRVKHLTPYGNCRFDILILSVGEDGHICSLFPHQMALHTTEMGYIQVGNSPKPPAKRITISPECVCTAKYIFLIFQGRAKEVAWKRFGNPNVSVDDCPAKLALVRREPGTLFIIRDRGFHTN